MFARFMDSCTSSVLRKISHHITRNLLMMQVNRIFTVSQSVNINAYVMPSIVVYLV